MAEEDVRWNIDQFDNLRKDFKEQIPSSRERERWGERERSFGIDFACLDLVVGM